MANHYSPKQFLRQVPKSPLKEFFDQRGELSDLEWDELDDTDVDPVFESGTGRAFQNVVVLEGWRAA
jgi:hypothetical protein